jgi:hypothetical protein
LQFVTLPFNKALFDFNPQVGLEIGKNLTKPSVLFDHPVDLSRYDAIRRFVAGADADLCIPQKNQGHGRSLYFNDGVAHA